MVLGLVPVLLFWLSFISRVMVYYSKCVLLGIIEWHGGWCRAELLVSLVVLVKLVI